MSEPSPSSVVPVIDISPFCSTIITGAGKDEDGLRALCATQWNQAMSTVGFAVIVGHGIDLSTIEAARSGFTSFFKRDLTYKQTYEYGPYGHTDGGYTSMGGEAVARSQDGHGNLGGGGDDESSTAAAASDPVESFVCTSGDPSQWGHTLPSQPPELASTAAHYHAGLSRVLDSLHRISEVALNLPDGYFDAYYKPEAKCYLVAKYYPPGGSENGLLYGAHTDYTGYTILKPDDGDHKLVDGGGGTTGGLQVKLRDEWHNVVLPPSVLKQAGLVVNLGDLWEDWTNGRWISAAHRVMGGGGPAHHRRHARLSIPFFTGPRNSALISTLPTCRRQDENEEVKLAKPITAGEHLQRKLESTQT